MQEETDFRDLMPKGFLPQLSKDSGVTDPSALSRVVRYEQTKHKAWPFALAIAEKNDPDGFAKWAAANPEKLPKVAA
ncbi:MAG: hypothetical protein ACRYFZ_00620 [Janthinobacterium lividum]